MKRKRILYKVLVLTVWLAVIAGLTTLLIAASNRKVAHLCKRVEVLIKGSSEKYYIEKGDIQEQIESVQGRLAGKPLNQIDLGLLESTLESNAWIKDAEIYFDNLDVLHVVVREREPIARVFTTFGNSFYIDTAAVRMPLLETVTARVPIVTGFTAAKRLNNEDSALLYEVKAVAQYIYNHEFWNAQTGQIDITPERKFEIIPVIGDHVIKIGNAERIEEKLNNLLIFYKQIISKAGFTKYRVLDAQYKGQIVAVNRGAVSKVDSIQLQKNIQELLNRKLEDEQQNAAYQTTTVKDSTNNSLAQNNQVPLKTIPNPTENRSTTQSNPAKTTTSKPVEKPKQQTETRTNTSKQPKAVMKKGG